MIDDYSFGRILVDGTQYGRDIVIYPNGRVHEGWRRKEGHKLCIEDIAELASSGPEVIIAGTGAFGLMQPAKDLAEQLSQKGIAFEAVPSKRASERYNEICSQRRTGACFHLTC